MVDTQSAVNGARIHLEAEPSIFSVPVQGRVSDAVSNVVLQVSVLHFFPLSRVNWSSDSLIRKFFSGIDVAFRPLWLPVANIALRDPDIGSPSPDKVRLRARRKNYESCRGVACIFRVSGYVDKAAISTIDKFEREIFRIEPSTFRGIRFAQLIPEHQPLQGADDYKQRREKADVQSEPGYRVALTEPPPTHWGRLLCYTGIVLTISSLIVFLGAAIRQNIALQNKGFAICVSGMALILVLMLIGTACMTIGPRSVCDAAFSNTGAT